MDCDDVINFSGHHLTSLGAYMLFKERDYDLLIKIFDQNYDREMLSNVESIFERILNNNVKLRLTNSLDAVCAICVKKDKCINNRTKHNFGRKDKEIIRHLGLKLNKVYDSDYLVRLINDSELGELNYNNAIKYLLKEDH